MNSCGGFPANSYPANSGGRPTTSVAGRSLSEPARSLAGPRAGSRAGSLVVLYPEARWSAVMWQAAYPALMAGALAASPLC